jgi:hypothetical protein
MNTAGSVLLDDHFIAKKKRFLPTPAMRMMLPRVPLGSGLELWTGMGTVCGRPSFTIM